MPIKKDDTGKRRVEMETLVPGTPEQVWQALATGPGNTAWFTKTTVEERVGGRIRFEFGPGAASEGEVTAWEPPARFEYVERDWSEGAPAVATEITITARSGGQCLVRMVHSLYASTDDWDDQMEGFESGWPAFFEVLRIYLAHFAGLPAACFTTMTSTTETDLETWRRMTTSLGLAGANAGDHLSTVAEPQSIRGIVESIHQDRRYRFLVMRLERPFPGILAVGTYAADGKARASVTMYVYGHQAEALASSAERQWADWLQRTVPVTA